MKRNRYKYTGYERDTESNLDYAFFRQYSLQYGRFMSPDPLHGNLLNPQSWNRYAYVLNNPTNLVDPLGLCEISVTSQDANGNFHVDCADPAEPGDRTPNDAFSNEPRDNGNGPGPSGGCSMRMGAVIISLGACPGRGGRGGRRRERAPDKKQAANSGFTLGIRAPGQTWKQCMGANANTYSIGGSLELTTNVAFNKNTSISSNTFVGAVTGNSINTFFFGSTPDAAATMAADAPGLVSTAMGTATTFGRRPSTIMSLNLAGTPGRSAVAVSQASGGVKAVLGRIGNVFSLGMSFATRTAVDVGFTGAEAINCAIPR